jgi:cell division protein FtsA
LGGNIITKDIKEGCNVMGQQAEKLKVKFGAAMTDALTENRIITIPGLRRRSHKEISEVNLSRIIQARMEEILDLVYWEIRRSGFERKLIGGIVLTGGGSLLRNLVDLVELHTGMSTRLGLPTEHLANGYDQEISSPIYATSVGLILNGFKELSRGYSYESSTFSGQHDFETSSSKDSNQPEKTNRWLEKVFKKTKEWFEAEPDGDF